jgi:hypothetical protein
VIHYKGESTIKDGTYMKRFREAMNFFYKKHFKVSFLFSVFMEMGIVFFSFVKMFQGKPKAKLSPENYLLISDNEILRDKLEKQFNKKVLLLKEAGLFSQNSGTEIIFDQNYLDFKTIIQALETNKNNHFTFKILPQSADFVIGSNSSFDRGEVFRISDL